MRVQTRLREIVYDLRVVGDAVDGMALVVVSLPKASFFS